MTWTRHRVQVTFVVDSQGDSKGPAGPFDDHWNLETPKSKLSAEDTELLARSGDCNEAALQLHWTRPLMG